MWAMKNTLCLKDLLVLPGYWRLAELSFNDCLLYFPEQQSSSMQIFATGQLSTASCQYKIFESI